MGRLGLKITRAEHGGFCFGVRDALDKARTAAQEYGQVYMLGDIVHNERVVQSLEAEGARVVGNLDEVKDGPVLFRAHGTPPEVWEAARQRGLHIIDATCPLVHEIHKEVRKLHEEGRTIILIGDHGHEEVEGIRAQVPKAYVVADKTEAEAIPRLKKAGVVSQSTQMMLNVQEIISVLLTKVFDLRFINTVCFPTRRNQQEIRELAAANDVLIVVGSRTSANTKRLVRVAQELGAKVYQVEQAADIQTDWFRPGDKVGVTAGASSPEDLIAEVVDRLSTL